MMKVLLVSSEDPASLNIRDRLMEEADWERIGDFFGSEVLHHGNLLMFQKEGTHLYFENVDMEIAGYLSTELPEHRVDNSPFPLELLVFLSRHRSEKDVRSLTVHPPGNFLNADFGGESGRLPPSSPYEMTAALRALYREKKALGLTDQTTYEVTHHGPLVSSPSFFIEIGSDASRWEIPDLGRAIARALLSEDLLDPPRDLPAAIGIGGGHYAPRFTDRAMRGKFAFGHMIPDYILNNSNDLRTTIKMALEATKGAKVAFIHRSRTNEDSLKGVYDILEDVDVKAV
ncbi:MAG: D-aminoacyl-tRNA deacylase [Thermoplasmatota archaeon]